MQSFRPSLSSISQNIVRGGFEAAALIEHLLNDEEATYQDVVLQPVNIINRLSTDFYSTTDAHIQTALKYIHQNIAADITVSDIVKQVPLSRRLLEIRFKQVTQQSIHKYIFNLRMERFAQLLLASDAPIADVAEQVGINNLKNLSRQFKALKKVSPNEYRKEYQTKSYQRWFNPVQTTWYQVTRFPEHSVPNTRLPIPGPCNLRNTADATRGTLLRERLSFGTASAVSTVVINNQFTVYV